ncbi:substrate-binding domain-containing protein [Amycolatopsis sp. A133]|uniref:VWA domain-containing protein n=1 Tax=Amycolatopsis sp. A133 TaxID=3064472 RepID=UPI0027E63903|nr:VWA domain-containing protein [Amycolatopsis sp. A133]MDQ7807802.1 substrate-binding domain-containing protein [Amycolatopsis sp. A133]
MVRVVLVLVLLLTACSPRGPADTKLTVLATSELADLGPVLADLRRDTGVELAMAYRGTMEAAAELDCGFDLAWLSTGRFLRLRDAEPGLSTSIMLSPLVFGVKASQAAKLGAQPTWADIADRAAGGELKYGMADPHVSGTGMAALIGVATAAAGTGAALRPEDVRCDRIQGFLSGRAFGAPDVTGEYVRRQDEVGGIVAPESAILALNASGRLREPLEVVYPRDGIVLADYPLMLLNPGKRAAYDKVVQWLRTPAAQRAIMDRTFRRPADPAVPRTGKLATPIGDPLYFPDRQEVLDRLLQAYDRAGTGRQVVFVLDYSLSMAGPRVAALRRAFAALSGFDRFYAGEQVTIIRFAGEVLEERAITVAGRPDADALRAVVASADLRPYTAIWSALERAYRIAKPGASIVLMTDGENNAGLGLDAFLAGRHDAGPTYAIRFGEADPAELGRVTAATGGRVVDGNAESLTEAVRELRGCR